MSFTSYAQNLEDVMLWRALRDRGPGFYIDVGAYHSVSDSVTQAFYERGWRGINIEPLSARHDEISSRRDRDINLNVAVGDRAGGMPFYEVVDTGMSTLSEDIANTHRDNGWSVVERRIEIRTLAEICAAHAPPDIHFLKIDVEGAERAVLAGADFERFRPWIVLVEAVEPGRPVLNHHGWDPVLRAARYEFVWFDGLNRFYVAAERMADLASCFTVQPNVFDNFVVHGSTCGTVPLDVRVDASGDGQAESIVTTLYRSLLLREPDPAGGQHFARLLAETGDLTGVIRSMLTSTGFAEGLPAFHRHYGVG